MSDTQQCASPSSSVGQTATLYIRGLSPDERHGIRMLAAAANQSINAYCVSVFRELLSSADPRVTSLLQDGRK